MRHIHRYHLLIIFVNVTLLAGCRTFDVGGLGPGQESNVQYGQAVRGNEPPCLNIDYVPLQCVIRSAADYDSLKVAHAPQGPYEEFAADGIRTMFKLSYLPLGSGREGHIGPSDLAIYLTGQPIYVSYGGRTIKVDSDPFYVSNDSILIFDGPGSTAGERIPYRLVFGIDSLTGEVTFVSPPPAGDRISISASRTLFTSYEGRDCSMNYFDFSLLSLVGIQVVGNGCLKGFDEEVTRNDLERKVTIRYVLRSEQHPGGCPDIVEAFSKWLVLPKIPDGYSVVFEEEP